MIRIFLLLVIIAVLGACTNGRPRNVTFDSTVCGGEVKGLTLTAVHYGDSRMIVLPISKVRRNTELQFMLIPKRQSSDNKAFDSIKVEIKGSNADSAWIGVNKSFGEAAKGMVVAGCVPNDPIDTEYEFDITVPGVGFLDPRAKVVN
jgi:hypothetical protein